MNIRLLDKENKEVNYTIPLWETMKIFFVGWIAWTIIIGTIIFILSFA